MTGPPVDPIVQRLLRSDEPSVRYKAPVGILGESPDVKNAQDEVRRSPRVEALLSKRQVDGTIRMDPYTKWRGAHWARAHDRASGRGTSSASPHQLQ